MLPQPKWQTHDSALYSIFKAHPIVTLVNAYLGGRKRGRPRAHAATSNDLAEFLDSAFGDTLKAHGDTVQIKSGDGVLDILNAGDLFAC